MKYIYTMTTQDGAQVNLTMNDLAFAHNLYRFFATREHIQDNCPNLTDQQLDIVTDRTLALKIAMVTTKMMPLSKLLRRRKLHEIRDLCL